MQSDLLIALGRFPSFDDRVTSKVPDLRPWPRSSVRHRPAELGKVRQTGRPDRRRLPPRHRGAQSAPSRTVGADAQPDHRLAQPHVRLAGEYPLTYEQRRGRARLKPQFVPRDAAATTPDDTIVASGVGQHQMWASQHWKFNHLYPYLGELRWPRHHGLLGARRHRRQGQPPDRMVWAIDGDGCFQMTAQEVTAVTSRIRNQGGDPEQRLPGHGAASGRRCSTRSFSEVYLSPDLPDYKLCRGHGLCEGMRVESPEDVLPTRRPTGHRPPAGHRLPSHRPPREGLPMVPAGAAHPRLVVEQQHRGRPSQGEGPTDVWTPTTARRPPPDFIVPAPQVVPAGPGVTELHRKAAHRGLGQFPSRSAVAGRGGH